MTDTLERLTNEVRKLTSPEVDQLRTWIMDYRPDNGADTVGRKVDWSGHAKRVKEIFGDIPPAKENTVLASRQEERF
jgi:hypothetical protein